jgi:hypothetical protein
MPNDYLLDYSTGHLQLRNGDFVIGEATEQHQRRLLLAHKGEYKQHPLAGVGLADFIDEENPDEMIREIRVQLVQDGMTVNTIKVTPKGLGIDANYE